MISKFFSLLFTVYSNFRYLPFNQAKLLPIKINHKVRVRLKRGDIIISAPITRFMIKMGFQGSGFIPYSTSSLEIMNNGKLFFQGTCILGEGCNIFVNHGSLTIGNNFYANRNLIFQAEDQSIIGDNVLIGWNVSIRDTDGHIVNKSGIDDKSTGGIKLKDGCWIAAQVTILKETIISKGSIVGTGSIVIGLRMETPHCMIAGIPARIRRTEVNLKK